MSRALVLPLKRQYFEEIKAGTKALEYRLITPYWRKRLTGKQGYSHIVLTLGYPASGDESRRLYREWRGYRETVIQHPLFGSRPVDVFAIDVSKEYTR